MTGGYRIGRLQGTWSGAPGVSLRGDLSGLGGALTVARGAKVDIGNATTPPPSFFVAGQFVVKDANVSLAGTMGGDCNGALVLEATQTGAYTVTLPSTHLNSMRAAMNQNGRTDAYTYGESRVDVCGRIVIKGDSAAGKIMTCKAQSWSAFPTNGIVEVRDGGVLDLTEMRSKGGPNKVKWQNDSATIRVYKGGIVKHNNNWTTLNEQKIELRGGIFESQRTSEFVTYSYQNNMLFEDGGALTSKGGTYWAGNSTAPSWKVRGTSPSSCEAPIQVLAASILRMMTLDVADVTGNDQPDFIFRQSVKRHNDLPLSGINKTGIGTALLMGVFDLRNGLQVSCGTFMLGISNGWTGGAITLHGGTFAVSNNTVNTIPSVLKLDERGGAIQLGNGAKLSFLDSSGETWVGDGILVVKNFAEGALRIGTTGDGLNDDQKGKIFWYDAQKNKNRPLRILGNGYLTAQIGMVISIH